jgi:cholesterol transport system auxiliary component
MTAITNRRHFLTLGAASLALTGCGDLLGPPPASPIYVLDTGNASAAAAARSANKTGWSLAVMRPSAPAALNGERIPLVQPDAMMDYYANANLPDSIPDLVQAALVQAFEGGGALAGVSREADALHADYDLFVDIRDFEMHYSVRDGVPEALVTLSVRLATARGRVETAASVFSQRVPASANSVAAAAAALGQALGAVIRQIVSWAAAFPAPPATAKP